MKTKKNLALFALTLGATAVLAACGGSKSDSSQASSQNAGSSELKEMVLITFFQKQNLTILQTLTLQF